MEGSPATANLWRGIILSSLAMLSLKNIRRLLMGTATKDHSAGGYLKPDRIPQAFIRRFAAASAFGASLFAVVAMGQQAPAASAEPELQEIIVTGSMIKRP